MNTSDLILFISALAIIVAEQVPDDDKLGLLASALTQLADSLSTIAVQRSILNEQQETEDQSNLF